MKRNHVIMNVKINKSDHIKSEILKQIELGNFSRGALLPSERNLARDFRVSYMTARKAVNILVGEKYLERIPGKGTFVHNNLSENKIQKQIGIICPAWESPEISEYIMYASEAANENNFLLKPYYYRFWEDKTIADAWESTDALIMVSPGPLNTLPDTLRRKFASNEKPVIIVGVPGLEYGFDTVMGKPESELSLAMDVLREAGHCKIAYVDQYNLVDNRSIRSSQDFYNRWSEIIDETLGPDMIEKLYLGVSCSPYRLPHKAIYEKLKKTFPQMPFTALVISVSHLWGAIAAFEDMGVKIPDDVSIVAIGDRQEVSFYRPAPTYIKVSRKEHMFQAVNAIKQRIEKPGMPPQHIRIHAEIIYGETVKNIK
jgi:DNA-binding LacI/PurR family transcriptional regulator